MHRAFVLVALGMLLLPTAHAQDSVPPTLGPVQAEVQPDGSWTLQLLVPYCGGPSIGDGVYLQALDPLRLPDTVAPGSVLLAEQPADASIQDATLRVTPQPGTLWAQYCTDGLQPIELDLQPTFGLDAGGVDDPTLLVWTGLDPTPQTVTALVPGAPASDGVDQASDPAVTTNATLAGVVLVGPTCPVQPLNDPTGRCADRPYAALVRVLGADGSEVARAQTDPRGAFALDLAAGAYQVIASAPDGRAFPRPSTQLVSLAAGQTVQLTLRLDSGIR